MKKAILLSALLGWASAPLLVMAVTLAKPGGSFAGDFWLPVLIYTAYSGVLAFPSCLIAGALVNQFLPASSPWWQPKYAALCGALCGAATVISIMAFVISGEFEFQAGQLFQGIFGAVPGAVCGLSLAWFKQKRLQPESPTPPP